MLLLTIHILLRDIDLIKEDLKKLWKVIKPYLTIKMLLSYWLVWMVIHLPFYLGSIFLKGTLKAICLAYIGIIYLPFVSENVFITFPVSIWLYRKLWKEEPTLIKKMLQKEKRE